MWSVEGDPSGRGIVAWASPLEAMGSALHIADEEQNMVLAIIIQT